MEEIREGSSPEDLSKATNAYKASIDLWKLGSDQVHSRLSAMLTGNSIIIAVSGLAIANKTVIPSNLIIALIIGGLVLCLVWGFFVFHGVRVENYYRKKTIEFERIAIPEGTRALRLLEHFKKTKNYIAVVIDEYGGVQGLVTVTDLVEEVLGEFSARADFEPMAVQRKDGTWLIDGMIPIVEFKNLMQLELLPGEEDEDFQTLGGYVMLKLEKVPTEGESFESAGLNFEIVDMDGNRVDKILVSQTSKSSNNSTS
jgi:hypothetical protein